MQKKEIKTKKIQFFLNFLIFPLYICLVKKKQGLPNSQIHKIIPNLFQYDRTC